RKMMSEERRRAIARLMFGKNADIAVQIFPMLLGMWGVPPPAPPPPPESQKGESENERKQ
ncbi:MAG: hypothetical protein ACTSP1_19545, partial [Candidatus Freyarchaeota archaeon]